METKLTGLRFPLLTLKKLKYIAWFNRSTFTDLIVKAADSQIQDFEKTNGAITADKIKEAKI